MFISEDTPAPVSRCRGQVISGFIVDFYCHRAALVIEVDGDVHEQETQKESDVTRDNILNELGLRVIRFRNEEILKKLSQTVETIKELISI